MYRCGIATTISIRKSYLSKYLIAQYVCEFRQIKVTDTVNHINGSLIRCTYTVYGKGKKMINGNIVANLRTYYSHLKIWHRTFILWTVEMRRFYK